MTDESAISHARRVQPSAFDRHDFDSDVVRVQNDRPLYVPEDAYVAPDWLLWVLGVTVALMGAYALVTA